MENIIRKISIGSDYKSDAMHYSLGQSVYGGHNIESILFHENTSNYTIYIKKDDEVKPWKNFNANMAIAIEYVVEY
jgi:hypothetical protein